MASISDLKELAARWREGLKDHAQSLSNFTRVNETTLLRLLKEISQCYSTIPDIEKISLQDPIIQFQNLIIDGNPRILDLKLPDIQWSNIKIHGSINFENVEIDKAFTIDTIHKNGEGVHPEISFKNVTFHSNINIKKTNVSINLIDVRVKGPFSLNTGFPILLNLDGVTFGEAVSIEGAIQKIDIQHTAFNGDLTIHANLNHVSFEWNGRKKNLKFLGSVDFNSIDANAGIFEKIDFSEIDWHGDVSFKGMQFSGPANFSKSKFRGKCNFNRAIFSDSTTFFETHFHHAPTFHEASLHRDTSFTDSKFDECSSEEDWRAFRRLREIMGDFKADVENSIFFGNVDLGRP